MADFFQTVMGRKFYEGDIPRISNALEKIAERLTPAPVATREVYVLVYRHRHGMDVSVYHDNRGAEFVVWDIMKEYYEEFTRKASESQVARFRDTMAPPDLGKAVAVWGEVLEEEGFEIHKRDVT